MGASFDGVFKACGHTADLVLLGFIFASIICVRVFANFFEKTGDIIASSAIASSCRRRWQSGVLRCPQKAYLKSGQATIRNEKAV